MMNSAPASTLCCNRRHSASRSGANGLTPTPMRKRVGSPNGWPAISSPRLRRTAMFVRPTASTSETAVASAYVPCGGGTPVVSSTFRTPIDVRPDQVRLHPDERAVAAGIVQDGFGRPLLFDQRGQGQRGRAGAAARVIRNVDGRGAGLAERGGLPNDIGQIQPPGRRDLGEDDEPTLVKRPTEGRLLPSATLDDGGRPGRGRRRRGPALTGATFPEAGVVNRIGGAILICRMWSGVVPQQPPTRRAPAAAKRRA